MAKTKVKGKFGGIALADKNLNLPVAEVHVNATILGKPDKNGKDRNWGIVQHPEKSQAVLVDLDVMASQQKDGKGKFFANFKPNGDGYTGELEEKLEMGFAAGQPYNG